MENTDVSPKEWLERYYAHLGEEIGVAFSTINANTEWALTLLFLLVSAIFLSGVFPDVRAFLVLLLVSPLLIRFFVRTTLGYQNLIRWNYFRARIDKIFLGVDKDGSIMTDLLKSIDLFDWNWGSPMSRGRLFLANVRYGFGVIFVLTYGLALYSWFALDSSTIFAPSPDRSWALAAIFFAAAFTLIEIRGLHDPFYFKYVPTNKVAYDDITKRVTTLREAQKKATEEKPSQNNNKVPISKTILKQSKKLHILAFVLLSISVGLLAGSETSHVILTLQSFPFTTRQYSLSYSIEIRNGDKVSFSWFSDLPITVIIAEMPIIQDYNRTGFLSSVSGIDTGQSGRITFVSGNMGAFGVLVSSLSLKVFTGEVTIERSSNSACGIIVGSASLLPLAAILISQVVDVVVERSNSLFEISVSHICMEYILLRAL